MHCHEFRDIMRSFLDGEVDGKTRKKVGLHLAECPECAALVESDGFWDDALRDYLDHELPAGLRSEILGDLDNMSARDNWRVAWWAVKRDLNTPRAILQTAGLAAAVLLAVMYLPFFQSPPEAFTEAGPIVQVGSEESRPAGDTEPTARLTLSGRLI